MAMMLIFLEDQPQPIFADGFYCASGRSATSGVKHFDRMVDALLYASAYDLNSVIQIEDGFICGTWELMGLLWHRTDALVGMMI